MTKIWKRLGIETKKKETVESGYEVLSADEQEIYERDFQEALKRGKCIPWKEFEAEFNYKAEEIMREIRRKNGNHYNR